MLSNFNPYERFCGISHWSCKVLTEPGGIIQEYMRCLVTEDSSIPGVTAAVMLLPALPVVFCCSATVAVPFFVVFGSSHRWDMGHTVLRYASCKDLATMFERDHRFPVLLSWATAFLAGTCISLPLALLATALLAAFLLVVGTPLLTIMTATYLLKMTIYTLNVLLF